MTAEGLARRLVALPSVEMRRAVLREAIEAAPPAEAVEILHAIVSRGRRRGPPYDVALVALGALLEDGEGALPYESCAALYEAARAAGRAALANLLLGARAAGGSGGAAERSLRPGGRALTLGERKALARGPRGETLDRLLRDGNPQVVRALLANPRLTEKDVVAIAALRPQNGENLREVSRARRWIARASVRRALVWNPHTPLAIARRLVPLLDLADLAVLAEDGAAGETLRDDARELLRVRRDAEREG